MSRVSSFLLSVLLLAISSSVAGAGDAPIGDDTSGEVIIARMWDQYRKVGTEIEDLEIFVIASTQKDAYTTEDARNLIEQGGTGVTHKRATRYTFYADDRMDKIHVRFSLPRRDAGTGFLVHRNPQGQDNQWLFLPALRKVRQVPISSMQTFVGTNFIYEDIRQLAGERTARFEYDRLPDEDLNDRRCHVVVARPKSDANSAYSSRKTWIDSEVLYPAQVEYQDSAGKLWKRLRSSSIEPVDKGSYRAALTEMRDLQLGETTLLWIKRRAVGETVPPEVFTRDYLERPIDF